MEREEGEVLERKQIRKQKKEAGGVLRHPAEIGKWFQILCFMNIPVFGFVYMFIKLLRRKTPGEQRYFAAAYLIYRILVLVLAGTILFILYKIGLDFMDSILQYADRMAK
ncbi:MAG: hypothetical protein IJ733_09995 [Lachnospiraceae bacterium]|nr:hypothetical protein [Lachnospiraceae bacterium]